MAQLVLIQGIMTMQILTNLLKSNSKPEIDSFSNKDINAAKLAEAKAYLGTRYILHPEYKTCPKHVLTGR